MRAPLYDHVCFETNADGQVRSLLSLGHQQRHRPITTLRAIFTTRPATSASSSTSQRRLRVRSTNTFTSPRESTDGNNLRRYFQRHRLTRERRIRVSPEEGQALPRVVSTSAKDAGGASVILPLTPVLVLAVIVLRLSRLSRKRFPIYWYSEALEVYPESIHLPGNDRSPPLTDALHALS